MRVLVTDDDESVRESLRKILAGAGHEVIMARNGEEAMERLGNAGTDLLLLDLEMPKRDGWDVLEDLSARVLPVAVIVITGRTDQLDTRAIPGTDALLEKPVDAEVLLDCVARVSAKGGSGRAYYGNDSARCRYLGAVTGRESSRGRGEREDQG